jgi:hypothetical protein
MSLLHQVAAAHELWHSNQHILGCLPVWKEWGDRCPTIAVRFAWSAVRTVIRVVG